VENVAVVKEATAKPKVEKRFCASLKLWRTRDAVDAGLKLQIKILPKLRMYIKMRVQALLYSTTSHVPPACYKRDRSITTDETLERN
jgi:hypothetical protein